jgi:VIT1/CCC1 family predicted Fe2+/Mn2+ transporter
MSVVSSGTHERVLDPIERLSEILFGLIMVLSFTCSISVAAAERAEVREVVVGAIGCNLAWGIVDGIMYLMAIVLERGRALAVARAVRASKDPEHGRQLMTELLPAPVDKLFDAAALESARAKLVALPELPRARLQKRDWLGALAVFLVVFLCTFPVVIPFVVFEPLQRSMRVSNAVAIAMLFIAGFELGRYAGLGKWRTGFIMVAIGLVLVGITIALGG